MDKWNTKYFWGEFLIMVPGVIFTRLLCCLFDSTKTTSTIIGWNRNPFSSALIRSNKSRLNAIQRTHPREGLIDFKFERISKNILERSFICSSLLPDFLNSSHRENWDVKCESQLTAIISTKRSDHINVVAR